MFKLALKNITSKPLRTLATMLAIAVAVAMIFCMLSFKGAVFEFIFASETAKAGDSDIVISSNSSSDRIFDVSQELLAVDGVENVTKSLTLYALLDDEYVQLRGFLQGHLFDLQQINTVSGSADDINDGNYANLVISKATAKHFGLSVDDSISLSIGNKQAVFYIGAIAEQDGYFFDDAPYQFVGIINGISRLLSNATGEFCNEIYIKITKNADINKVIADISQIEQYSKLLVKQTKDSGYIAEQTDSLTAPVVLSGGAVLLLGIAIIVLLFMMSESEKVNLIAKLSVIGATKKQIFSLFLMESVLLAGGGVLLGSVLAVGIFVGLLKLTLSVAFVVGISVVKLFVAAIIGFVSAVVSSVLPMARAFSSSIRDNQNDVVKHTKLFKILPIVMCLLTLASLIVEFCVPVVRGAFAVVSLVLALFTIGVGAPYLLKGAAKLSAKSSLPAIKIGGVHALRTKRFSRTITTFAVGMTVCVMLVMAWVLTTTIFSSFVSNFENMVFISNVPSTLDTKQFESVDGVENATMIVWSQGELSVGGKQKTMNILGSKDTIDMVNFEFITAKSQVDELISSGQPYIFVDIALQELYGVSVGDTLDLSIENTQQQVVVGGILKHNLFGGNYIVIASDVIDNLYGIKPNMALLSVSGDMDNTVGALRTIYADKNYYVIKTLDAYKWDMESMNAVFDLIGTLAIVVAIFVLGVCIASTCIGRGGDEKHRCALLNVGMSKATLQRSELWEHFLVAFVSFAIALLSSVLLTACLIHALRLFGMFFDFVYSAWSVVIVGAIMSGVFALVPLAFKKGYGLKRKIK